MQIACCPYGFWPEFYRHVGIPHHPSHLCIQGSDHSFSCSILVLGVRWGVRPQLVYCTLLHLLSIYGWVVVIQLLE